MRSEEFSVIMDDGKSLHLYRWGPETAPKGLVLVAHGMAEHAGRYARLAERLAERGYETWAPDHRGHGKTAAEGELGWLAERDGFRRAVDDMKAVAERMRAERPGVPLALVGHSWGSFLSQGFISIYGGLIDACALSGSATGVDPMAAVGRIIAAAGAAIYGAKAKAPLLDRMSFGSFNDAFKPNRTAFDWLSRDPAEVDKYLADPYCGFVCSWGFFKDLLSGLAWISRPVTKAAVRKDLPLYIFAGERDPVGGAKGQIELLADGYRAAGVRDLHVKLYPGARHETLNETDRDEVIAELIGWLESRLTIGPGAGV